MSRSLRSRFGLTLSSWRRGCVFGPIMSPHELFEGSMQRGFPSRMNTTATSLIESSSPATGAGADYAVVIRPSKGFSKQDQEALWEFRELFYFLGVAGRQNPIQANRHRGCVGHSPACDDYGDLYGDL